MSTIEDNNSKQVHHEKHHIDKIMGKYRDTKKPQLGQEEIIKTDGTPDNIKGVKPIPLSIVTTK